MQLTAATMKTNRSLAQAAHACLYGSGGCPSSLGGCSSNLGGRLSGLGVRPSIVGARPSNLGPRPLGFSVSWGVGCGKWSVGNRRILWDSACNKNDKAITQPAENTSDPVQNHKEHAQSEKLRMRNPSIPHMNKHHPLGWFSTNFCYAPNDMS